MQLQEVQNSNELLEVVKLEKELFSNYVNFWSLDSFKEIVKNKDKYIFKILKKDNKVIGYIIFLIIDADTSELHKITISKDYQGQGLSKLLFNQVADDLQLKNIFKIILEVMIDNRAAISLYNSIGFKKIGSRKNYYKIIDNLDNIISKDALVMELKL